MTDEERKVMQQHIAYWMDYLKQGIMLVFGPVIDQKEVYGLGVVAVDDEDQLKSLIENDPASKINIYEYHPIKAVIPMT
jgi:uncharacterized protein YciI